MRIPIVLALAMLVSRPALAGPSVFPQLVCRGTVGVVTVVSLDGKRAQLRLEGERSGLMRSCRDPAQIDTIGAGYNPEGCIVEPALITAPKGHLAVGDRFLAALEPPAGAQCATAATATHLIPLGLLTLLVGVSLPRT